MIRKKLSFIVIVVILLLIGCSTLVLAADGQKPALLYNIQEGDTLFGIANQFNLDPELISLMNGISEDKMIITGETLVLPNEQTVLYNVKEGDTLATISRNYNVSIASVIKENELSDLNNLHVGQEITITAPLRNSVVDSIVTSNRLGISFLWPVEGIITSAFGMRDGRPHEGLDIAASFGEPVKAAYAGKVIFAGPRGTYGNTVILEHEKGYRTLYAHADKILVGVGDFVESGQEVSKVGSTGKSTGPHLHFEIRFNTVALDPASYLPSKR